MSTLSKAIYKFNVIPVNTNSIFHRATTNNPKISMEPQKTPDSQNNLEKEKESWKHHNLRLQVILQSCINQNIMIMVKK